mgnify:CR=1 FL=1
MTENRFKLKKSLRHIDSTALVAGSMIGSEIFIVSADMSRQLVSIYCNNGINFLFNNSGKIKKC